MSSNLCASEQSKTGFGFALLYLSCFRKNSVSPALPKSTSEYLSDKYSDVLFGNAGDTEFFLKQDRYKSAKPKPVLLCSDAHKLDDIGKKFSWIKSEKTFEGLKQVLYDPQSRVAIQDNEPIQPNSTYSHPRNNTLIFWLK